MPSLGRCFRLAGTGVAAASLLLLGLLILARSGPWAGVAGDRLSGAFTGWIAGAPTGTYTFTVPGGSGIRLAVDGRTVLDGAAASPVPLDTGLHAVHLEGRHITGGLWWSRNGGPAAPIPRGLLFLRRPGAPVRAAGRAIGRSLAGAEWLWVASLVAAFLLVVVTAWTICLRRSIEPAVDWATLRWIVAASCVLNAIPIWWGLPAIWPPDELMPVTVLDALHQHFSNGWFDRWPPLHYYVLTAAMSPVLILQALGRIEFTGGGWPAVLTLLSRLVSVTAAAGTVIAVCLAGARAFGRRAGLAAAAIFALALPFPYYAKTANLDVPYVFWFSLSLVCYLRFVETVTRRDAILFGVFAALAICTKDQAYALYPVMALVIAGVVWRAQRQQACPWWHILIDTRLLSGAAAAIVVFAICHNLLFNWRGFILHVRYIVGPGNENYRVFPATLAGRLQLLALTGQLIEWSWSWPLTMVCAAGLVTAFANRRWRASGLLLLAPCVSYYLGFIDIVLYNYDRFVMPLCLIFAIFGGLAVDVALGDRLRRGWRPAVAMGILAYSVLYAATVDALMLRDSRSLVQRWLRTHMRPGEVAAISGPRELEPSSGFPWIDVATTAQLERDRPAYYLLSADYAQAVPPQNYWGQLIAALNDGTAGYTRIARVRCPSPWPWLPWAHPELAGPRAFDAAGGVSSILRDVDPTIDIFARHPVQSAPIPCGTNR